jgi:hypothetical protein
MEASKSKRDMAWGLMMITFGVAALLNIFADVSEWAIVATFAAGGLVCLALYLTNRTDWTLLIPAYILLAVTLIAFVVLADLIRGDIIATAVLVIIGTPFLAVYLLNRENWWALIPAYVLYMVGIMVFLIGLNVLQDGIIPLYVLGSIGLPFLLVYFLNRENWWALIPAYVMFAVGIMVALIDLRVLKNFAIPAYVMFAIALPFFFVFLRNRKNNRWALIPGGITGVIGLSFFIATDLAQYVLPAVLLIAGVWILFGSVGRRKEDE